ncbi:MAG: molecular chaperone HtpG [Selenomonadaceae bacterium]|nr:molecular chaperone HtpG [Selenomonadaceae bacterium]
MAKQTLEFQAETKRLLDLVVNSIYTNKEIFLRELISNASDALDKLHFESLTNQDILEGNDTYEIYVLPDPESKTITISDNGIGMSQDEVIANIGTIAKSGTKAFLEKIKETSGDATEELIGQFGVGFYSAFIVADKVTLITRRAGEKAASKWESDGAGEFTIEECEKESRGTTITLKLKDAFTGSDGDEKNFTDVNTIERLIKKYSDYIRYPIKMNFEVEKKDDDDKDAEPIKTIEVRTVNSMMPLWTRNKNEITPEEYNEFFKHQFHEWEPPLEIMHSKAEGTLEYTALLCIPKKAAYDLYYSTYEPGLQLYSRHVFIMDKCKDFLPDHLRFVKGLVDSPDLPLNISRELLQQSREMKKIGQTLEKNILKQLSKMLANDRDKYEEFWAEYGKALKIGIYNDIYSVSGVGDKLKDLLIFKTSKDKKFSTLAEYFGRMKADQTKIYYAVGKDEAAIEKLPQMELLRDRDIEVLYMLDPVDEFAVSTLRQYEGKEFQSITREDFELEDDESKAAKEKTEAIAKDNETLLKDVKEALNGKVDDVRLTSRLKSGAVCLATGSFGPSLSMEKVFDAMNNPMFKAIKILELNPNHAIFERLKVLDEHKDSDEFKTFCELLYAQALLIEGVMPDDPAALAGKIAELMSR